MKGAIYMLFSNTRLMGANHNIKKVSSCMMFKILCKAGTMNERMHDTMCEGALFQDVLFSQLYENMLGISCKITDSI